MKTKFVLLFSMLFINMKAFSGVCDEIQSSDKSLNFNKLVFNKVEANPLIKRIPIKELINKVGNEKTLGLTSAKVRITYKITTSVIWTNDAICVFPQEVQIDFGYPEMTIFAPDKYDENSCEYREIMNHEDDHVQNFIQMLEKYTPLIKNSAELTINKLKPIQIKDSTKINKATNYFMYQLDKNKEINDLRSQMQNELESKNNELDHPQNYKRITKKCGDW